MKKEKLIITLEIDSLPEKCKMVDFQMIVIEDNFMRRIFKNWKKITYIPVPITKMVVEKYDATQDK